MPEFTEREVNFVVSDREGYLSRLVPDLKGFDILALDRTLGTRMDERIRNSATTLNDFFEMSLVLNQSLIFVWLRLGCKRMTDSNYVNLR